MTEQINETVEEFNAEDAFDEAVANLFDNDTPEEDTPSEEPAVEDETLEDPEEDTPEQEDTEEDVTPVESAAPDYEALYNQMAAHNATLQNNIADAEHKLSSWEGRIEAARKEAAEEALKQAKADQPDFEITDEMAEVFELYPDMLPQVQSLINQKVSKEVSGVEERVAQLIEQHVSPIATRVQESEANAHESAILSAHPDIRQLIAGGEFRKWVETLPTYQQVGAQQICQSGSADEVISLFDSFKEATSADASNKSPNKTKATPDNKIVDKVKNAMSVPSAPHKVKTDAEPASEEDPDKLFAQAVKDVMKENA